MAESAALCAICGKRKPKRYCPGVGGDICPICCGTEREVTVNCPLDCSYLQEARRRDRLPDIDPRQFPNADIKVDEAFLQRNEALLIIIAAAVAGNALKDNNNRIIDNDVKQALASLVQTYRTLQTGLFYESRPDNPLAGLVHDGVQKDLADLRERAQKHGQSLRDSDILGILAFLQRLEIQHNNGRPKGRAFIDFLRSFFRPGAPGSQTEAQDEPLIEPGDAGSGLIITP